MSSQSETMSLSLPVSSPVNYQQHQLVVSSQPDDDVVASLVACVTTMRVFIKISC